MANRIVLNGETSYHGAGAIAEIATERQGDPRRHLSALTPDLVEFNVTSKVTKVLEDARRRRIYSISNPIPPLRTYRQALLHLRLPGLIISLPSAEAPPWIHPRPSASSLPTLNSDVREAWRALHLPRTHKTHAFIPILIAAGNSSTTAGTAAGGYHQLQLRMLASKA